MDILLLFFALSIILFVRPQKDKVNYFSAENTLPIRGIMAVAIILHHMAEKTNAGRFFPFMIHMGYLIVAVFFFFSGYGLMYSYNKKGKDYLFGFWKKRILYLVLVYVLVSLLYSVYHLINGDFRFSITIAANSWYIPIQIILYVFFWISFKFFGEKSKPLSILLVFVLQTALTVYLIFADYEGVWYISNYGFVAGIIWAYKKEIIDKVLEKFYWLCLVASVVLFGLFSLLPRFIGMYDACRMLSTVVFCIVVVLLLYQVKITGKFWSFIGTFSLEIYLMHGLVYLVLHNFISNNILWTALTVIISLPLAFLSSKVNKTMKKVFKI